jgi:hypothetical protein
MGALLVRCGLLTAAKEARQLALAKVSASTLDQLRESLSEASNRSTIDDVMVNADQQAEILAGLDAAVNHPATPPGATGSVSAGLQHQTA